MGNPRAMAKPKPGKSYWKGLLESLRVPVLTVFQSELFFIFQYIATMIKNFTSLFPSIQILKACLFDTSLA